MEFDTEKSLNKIKLLVQDFQWKRLGIHIFTHVEKYQIVVIGFLALIWNFQAEKSWPEPLIVLMTVVFAALALKKIIIKGNVDEDIEKTVSRSDPISDWHTNEEFSEDEHIAVYRKDPLVKIVRYKKPIVENFKEPWLEGLYPDPKANSYNVSIQYASSELINMIILVVDGGRVFLPLPKTRDTLETTEFDLAVCQILNGQTGYDTSYYFKHSKMILNTEQLEE